MRDRDLVARLGRFELGAVRGFRRRQPGEASSYNLRAGPSPARALSAAPDQPLTSTDVAEPTTTARHLLEDVARLTGKQPRGLELALSGRPDRQGTSGAYLVTVGRWRLTVRFLATEARYELTLHPNGTMSGSGRWAIARAELAGRWFFEPAGQVPHLELSGGIQIGTRAMAVKIARWATPDAAECMFEGRGGRLERIAP